MMLLMLLVADALMLLNQDQDLLADLSIAICSSYFALSRFMKHNKNSLLRSAHLEKEIV